MSRVKLLGMMLGVSFLSSVLCVEGQIRAFNTEMVQINDEIKQAAKRAEYTPTEYTKIIRNISQKNVQIFETCDTAEQIEEEIRLGEMEELAQLIHAEAGNQDLKGKRLVADVVLNRLDAGWADSLDAVLHQKNQFATISDGAFDRAAWEMTEEDFEASELEFDSINRLDASIFYFTAGGYNDSGTPAYKYLDHYFSRK